MSDQITCSDCGGSFVFSDAEREFYASKGLAPPKRCKACREARKARDGATRGDAPRSAPGQGARPDRRGPGRPPFRQGPRPARPRSAPPPAHRPAPAPVQAAPKERPEKPKFSIHCAACGIHAQVPFKPLEGREVFCQPCYRARPRRDPSPNPSPTESIDVGEAEAGIVE
jgi:CxxC-x17-CxxC domain-containing protein